MDIHIPIAAYLFVAGTLFFIGLMGLVLTRRNLIFILMCIELMLLAVNINFVAFSHFLKDLSGQVFTLMILTVSAAEAALGLAIFLVFYRNRENIDIDDISVMKG